MSAPTKTEVEKEQILVVEDSTPNRKILMHLLNKLGYEAIGFENGDSAWQALSKGEPKRIVAILSDVMMPIMDGITLLKHIRESEAYKAVPVVLVTAVSDKDYILQAKNLNVNGYILKPVTFQRVQDKLKELFPNKIFPVSKLTA
jgi:two-component system, chemotaxis family, chemotaxis protein CheY